MTLAKIHRFYCVLKEITRYLIVYRITKHRKKILGVRLRKLCEHLGPFYIKMGQMLSTRYDILKQKDAKALQELLDNCNPFPEQMAKKILREEIPHAKEIHKTLSKKPISVASISQVYTAKCDGKKVVVKIVRPRIVEDMQRDTDLLKSIARVALIVPMLKRIHIDKLIDDLAEWTQKETDLLEEAKSIKRVQENYAAYTRQRHRNLGKIIFPEVYKKFSTKKVLTLSYIEGIPAKDFKKVMHDKNYDPLKSVNTVLAACTHNMFSNRDIYFHGDPHPSNILMLKGGDAGLIDFGITGYLNSSLTKKTNDLYFAIYAKNIDHAIKVLIDLTGCTKKKKLKYLRKDLEAFFEGIEDEGIGYWMLGFFRILVKNKLPLIPNVALIGRANIVMEGAIKQIDPQATTYSLVGPEFVYGMRQKIIRNLCETDLLCLGYTLCETAVRGPEIINKLLAQHVPSQEHHSSI